MKIKTGFYQGLWGIVFTLASQPSSWGLSLLSDVDDTIKISHVNSIPSLLLHVPLRWSFSGMSTLYQGLKDSGSVQDFYYLSGTTTLLSKHLQDFLVHNQFPTGLLRLRTYFKESSKVKEYKLQALRELLKEETKEQYIMVGDDTEADADVYAQMKKEFPGRVDSIYIHRVRGVELSDEAKAAGASTFLTSMDLGIELYLRGKLNRAGLEALGKKILTDKHRKRIVAPFQKCPDEFQVKSVNDTDLDQLITQVQTKVESICPKKAETEAEPELTDAESPDAVYE